MKFRNLLLCALCALCVYPRLAPGQTQAVTVNLTTGAVTLPVTPNFTALKIGGVTVTLPAGAIVGTSDTQTLTNKTLTAPAINSPTGLVKADVGLGNVENTALSTFLPAQTGNVGKVLQTDGAALAWATPAAGGSTINTPDTAWLSPAGNDGTGAVGDPGHPFATAQAAWTALSSGHPSPAMVALPNASGYGDITATADMTLHLLGFGVDASIFGTITNHGHAVTIYGSGRNSVWINTIDASGADGAAGAVADPAINGGAGNPGAAGGNGGAVTIYAATVLTITDHGGAGGNASNADTTGGDAAGGDGGNGGAGGVITLQDAAVNTYIDMDGGAAGNGGNCFGMVPGGNAGNGGNGGQLTGDRCYLAGVSGLGGGTGTPGTPSGGPGGPGTTGAVTLRFSQYFGGFAGAILRVVIDGGAFIGSAN